MMTCPWCDEDALDLLGDLDADTFRCPACETCVDLVTDPVLLDAAA